MQRVVSVWTRWGDYVLGVRDLRAGQSLSVGARTLLHFRRGRANVCTAPGAAERELQVGESVTVTVGELDYTLCCAALANAPAFAVSRRPWALLDVAVLGALVALSVWPAARAPHALRPGIAARAELGPLASPILEARPLRQGVFAVG
jgi:hypothetical protein